jgi:hypothetical protein
MSVSCECSVLSGRGLYDGLITRPEESYRVWCVSNVCDRETWRKRGGPGPYRAVEPFKKNVITVAFQLNFIHCVIKINIMRLAVSPSSAKRDGETVLGPLDKR